MQELIAFLSLKISNIEVPHTFFPVHYQKLMRVASTKTKNVSHLNFIDIKSFDVGSVGHSWSCLASKHIKITFFSSWQSFLQKCMRVNFASMNQNECGGFLEFGCVCELLSNRHNSILSSNLKIIPAFS